MPMEASVRIFSSSSMVMNRHLPTTTTSLLLLKSTPLKYPCRISVPNSPQRPQVAHRPIAISSNPHSPLRFKSPFPPPSSTPSGFFQSLSTDHFDHPLVSDSKDKSFELNYAVNDGRDAVGVVGEKGGPVVTVVLLGWLGAKPRQLKRYVELYNSRGIHAVTFVASVWDVLSFDLGRRLEERISGLAGELGSWVAGKEKDGRERVLLFHTFSNTGWLAYGAILENLQGRQDLLMKIRGCVVDSGGDPDINPKVWAAGFTAALLKKRSSPAYPSIEDGEGIESEARLCKAQQKEPLLVETILLVVFEKLFSFLLNLSYVRERLTKTISNLSKNQPPCPQLYLYSTADKVIPSLAVEMFIKEQRRMGREVWSFNFGSSPHVDHYRTFPKIYSSQLQNFLKECLAKANVM